MMPPSVILMVGLWMMLNFYISFIYEVHQGMRRGPHVVAFISYFWYRMKFPPGELE